MATPKVVEKPRSPRARASRRVGAALILRRAGHGRPAVLWASVNPPAGQGISVPGEEPPGSASPGPATSVLVVGTDQWAIEQAGAQLRTAGREVRHCQEPGEPAFPCNALIEGRRCPLDIGVDVVLDVRARPVSPPPLEEFGAICALHAGVPLVVAGVAWEGGFSPWAAGIVAHGEHLVDACDAAVAEKIA